MLNAFASPSQNLVPNPSFEDMWACPADGRVYNCQHWVNFGQSPDYNHACAPVGNPFGVPENLFGYQLAATGNAYCDLWTYSTTALYREFLGVELILPLTIGHKYYASFKCSPGSPANGYCMQTDKLGIRFSTIAYDSINSAPIDNFAHIYTDSIVTDTAGWTIVNGSFIADSAYSYLMLGNFFDNAHTDILLTCTDFAVYYIDDVVVIDSSVTDVEENSPQNFVHYLQSGEVVLFSSSPCKINKVELYDYMGRIVNYSVRKDEYAAINIAGITPGVYIAVVFYHDTQVILKCYLN